MFDRFNRRIHYLRISVTDACNLACSYCRSADTEPQVRCRRADLLSDDEIAALVQAAAGLGIDKVRLTGGEPLLRDGIVDLVRRLSRVPGIHDLAMTTNGLRLDSFAVPLQAAGLHRLNISLDTVDRERFREITGSPDLARVLAGVRAAVAAGYRQVKLNCVIDQSPDEPDASSVATFAREQGGLPVQYIRRMDLAAGRFWPVVGGNGGRCGQCNRLRVACDGRIYPCLFSDACYSIRELGVESALRQAVAGKPAAGTRSHNAFQAIGG